MNNNRNFQIAIHLEISPCNIKSVEEWCYVYFVQFVTGSPRFVSKKVVKPAINPIYSTKHQVVHLDGSKPQAETYQVMARTDIRRGRWGSRNRGLKLKNINTSEYSWVNNERPYDKDIQVADYVRYDGQTLTVIKNAHKMLLAF